MRTTKVPDDAPPLVQKAGFSPKHDKSGGHSAVAAKLSLCAGLFAFLVNVYAASRKVHLSPAGHRAVIIFCGVLVFAGLALAVWALWSNRSATRRGVTGFAVASLLVNVIQIALHLHAYLTVRTDV